MQSTFSLGYLVSTGNVIRLVFCVVCVYFHHSNRFAILIIELTWQIILIEPTDKLNWAWQVQISHFQIENVFQCNWIIYIRYHKWAENARRLDGVRLCACVCLYGDEVLLKSKILNGILSFLRRRQKSMEMAERKDHQSELVKANWNVIFDMRAMVESGWELCVCVRVWTLRLTAVSICETRPFPRHQVRRMDILTQWWCACVLRMSENTNIGSH